MQRHVWQMYEGSETNASRHVMNGYGGRAEQQGKAKRFHAKQSKATQRHLSTAQRTGRPTQEQRRRAVVKSEQDWTGGHEWPPEKTGQDRTGRRQEWR